MLLTYLEWLAFSLGALTVYLYGLKLRYGAISGMICAVTFLLWGGLHEFWGAVTINFGFFTLHTLNLRKSFNS